MAKLQLLIAMVASGKSFYATKAAKTGIICLNDDAIVSMLHGGNYTDYDKQLKTLYKAVEHTIIDMAIAMNRTVLIDRGLNISRKARKRFLAIADSLDVECEALWFENEGPEIHAKRRFESDNRNHTFEYWLKVSEYHNSQWEEPGLEEGFSKITKLDWNSEVV